MGSLARRGEPSRALPDRRGAASPCEKSKGSPSGLPDGDVDQRGEPPITTLAERGFPWARWRGGVSRVRALPDRRGAASPCEKSKGSPSGLPDGDVDQRGEPPITTLAERGFPWARWRGGVSRVGLCPTGEGRRAPVRRARGPHQACLMGTWTGGDSNPGPLPCEGSALPAELPAPAGAQVYRPRPRHPRQWSDGRGDSPLRATRAEPRALARTPLQLSYRPLREPQCIDHARGILASGQTEGGTPPFAPRGQSPAPWRAPPCS